jgi:hypothetical protein
VIRPKNPRTPPGPLTVEPGEIVDFDGALWRIHRTTGAHPSAWDALRTYGPLPAMRWDPHPPPVADHPGCGVSYVATTPRTTFYEVFQDRPAITLTGSQSISAWTPARTLRLLDLTDSHWLVRHGASASLPHTRKDTCRSWARQIWEQLGTRIDGLLTPSTVNGAATVVLFDTAATSFPPAPGFTAPLTYWLVQTWAVDVSRATGWPIR